MMANSHLLQNRKVEIFHSLYEQTSINTGILLAVDGPFSYYLTHAPHFSPGSNCINLFIGLTSRLS